MENDNIEFSKLDLQYSEEEIKRMEEELKQEQIEEALNFNY